MANAVNGNKKRGGIIGRFVGNKNTVTILGILACIATLIVGYNYRVKLSINPINVPYAKQTIASRTLITSQMVGNIKISTTYTQNAENLVTNAKSVVNKYVSFKTSIPKNSLFYEDQLMDAEDLPDYAFSNIPDGYTIYSLAVDKDSSYYNSIRASQYIDLYLKATDKDEEGKLIYAKFIESIKVLAVKDSQGNNINGNGMGNGEPKELLFAVPEELYLLLMKAEFLNLSVEPVLRNAQYTKEENETLVKSEEIRAFILEQCSDI